MGSQSTFIFHKQEKIGLLDARDDKENLLENFIDTGDYYFVRKFDKPERFILGRTGSGKTALITKLIADEKHVISIEPESLSLIYISNTTIIKELNKLGVNFDLMFRYLWRHVLAVEVLNDYYKSNDPEAKDIVNRLKDKFRKFNPHNNQSTGLIYLDNYGSSFWENTQTRIKEIVSTFENSIDSELGSSVPHLLAKVKAQKALTEEQRGEVVRRAQNVINETQVKGLAEILHSLNDAIDNRRENYYIVIDRLDENWVEDELRYRLILALLETIKDFSIVERVKPLVVLRSDLISRVFDMTRTPGFQEEKFSSLNIHISWSKAQLTTMLNQRVNSMIQRQCSGSSTTHKDVLVPTVHSQKTIDYMLDRTLLRPRDLISFYNFCIEEANDAIYIDENMVLQAEHNYSRNRRNSIRDEWAEDYPNLGYWDKILHNSYSEFYASEIKNEDIQKLCQQYDKARMTKRRFPKDLIYEQLHYMQCGEIDLEAFVTFLLQAFYQVGYLGIKLPNYENPIWSHEPRSILHIEELKDNPVFYVHKCFWSCFNIQPVTTVYG